MVLKQHRRRVFIVAAVSTAAIGLGGAALAFSQNSEPYPADTPIVEIVELNEYQAPAFDDNVITFAEYSEALDTTFQCATDGGVTIEGPRRAPDGVTIEYFLLASSEDEANATQRVFDECYDEYAREIDIAYQTSPQVEAAIDEQLDALVSCLTDARVELDPAISDYRNVIENIQTPSYQDCRETLGDRQLDASIKD